MAVSILHYKSNSKAVWDARRRTYSVDGSRLTQSEIRGHVDAAIKQARSDAKRIAEEFISHRNSATFETEMKALLKNEHLSLSMIANGGREQMTQSLWRRVGSILKDQYSYLEAFGRQIDAGEISDALLLSRSDLYAMAGIGTFESSVRDGMADIGMSEALNILGGGNHCSECPEIADAGWMPIDEMSMPGERECMVNCLCSVEYR